MSSSDQPCCEAIFWMYVAICFALVSFAGVMSGLTLGLMSLSLVDLEVLLKAGQPQDRANAAKILPVVKRQHLLLCTLLIGNSLAMEALPIFLDALLPSWGAILVSVTLILSFAEIMPQAICSRYGLSVGAKAAWIVRVLLVVFFPIAYPISKLLDWLLGKDHFALMRRAELKTLVYMHGNEAGNGGELTHDETTIITGALDLTQKTAKDAMTAISETFSLDINSKLDVRTMGLVTTKGHSRVPIYSGNPKNIIGLILVKNLITCEPDDEVPIRNVTIRKIPRVYDDLPLYDILNEFQKGHSHMAVVVKRTEKSMASFDTNMDIMHEYQMDEKKIIPTNGITGVQPRSLVEHARVIENASAMNPDSPGIHSTFLRNNLEKQRDVYPQLKKSDRGRHGNILDVNSDHLPSYSVDEEVVGIITMEDVMEELLQEEILDETDEYVNVHNKIKINMLPLKRLSPGSPGATPISQYQQRTSMQSPHSPYHNYSNEQSPTSSPILTLSPTSNISCSLTRSFPSSPAQGATPAYLSPASHHASKNEENGEP